MIVIVLGMHRSGTSTFAGVLHMNKILMGNYETFWPRPLTQNPKGFYENYDFRKINDQILKLSGYYVKSYNTDIPSIDINDNLLLTMKKIVKEYNLRYENWGWKDPRTCLTVEYWVNIMQELDLSDDIKIIFVVRKALSALKFCNGSQLPTHYCSFEALLKDPLSTCDSLFGFLNEQWDPKVVDQFVDSSITSSQKGEEVTPPEDIVRLESELYSRVEK